MCVVDWGRQAVIATDTWSLYERREIPHLRLPFVPELSEKNALYVPFSSQKYHLSRVHLQRAPHLHGRGRWALGLTLHNQCEAHKEVPEQWIPLQSHPQTRHSDCRKWLIQLLYQAIQERKCKHISEVISAKCLDCCIVLYNHTKQIFSGVRGGDTEINFGRECFHRNYFCSLTSVSSHCWVFFSSSSFMATGGESGPKLCCRGWIHLHYLWEAILALH